MQAQPNTQYFRVNAPPLASDAVRIKADVAATFPYEPAFEPVVALVVTWFAVQPSGNSSTLNTYQAALATDAAGRSFATLW